MNDSSKTSRWQRLKLILEVIEVRLRFIAILAATGLTIGYWDTIKNYWDKYTRPAAVASQRLPADQEFYCPMHPQVTRSDYEPNGAVPNCPICGMPLSQRRKGQPPALPQGVTARVQLSPDRIQLAGVRTEPVTYRHLAQQLTTVGEVTYDESRLARITSRTNGYIERLLVDKTYARVHEGDPLAEIYSPDMHAAALELALLSKQDIGPNLLHNARHRLLLLGVNEREIDNIVTSGKASSRILVRSPRAGYVITKPIVTGSRVEEGMMLLEVADLSVVWIEASVFEKDSGLLAVGQTVEAHVEALPGRTFRGRVALVYPHVEAATRTNRVRFELENRDELLRPGMFATVRIEIPFKMLPTNANGELLAVAERAVIDTGERQIVYVEHEPGVFDGVAVRLGPRVEDYYPVLSGLTPGDRVAAAGAFLIDAETRLTPAAAATYFGATGGPVASRSPASVENKPTESGPTAEQSKNIDLLDPADRQLARAQRLCPITEAPLGAMGKPVKVVLRNQPVFLCCKGCVLKANKDPLATLKKVEHFRHGR
jgi:multidrug efflux pump subunit AcrA (membrane-fusion protein)